MAKPRTAGLLLSGATRSMAELAACEPFYAAPSGGTTAASYAHQAHAPAGFHEYTLVAKRDAGRDSKLLTFALPETMPTLGASVISGVKVKQEVAGEELDKSYSPTSPAERTETFDLLVKAYTPRKGGGLGAWLCALEPGQNASICVEIKILRRVRASSRRLHAIDATPARWRGDAGSSRLDGARTAASSPRNDLVKNCQAHPTH